jgi:hypothetical protein
MDVNRPAVTLDATQSHTGRTSLKVSSGDTVIIGGNLDLCATFNPCNLTACWNLGDIEGGWNISFNPIGGTAPYVYNYNITSGNSWVSGIFIDSYGRLNINFSNNHAAKISGVVTITDKNGCVLHFTFTAFYNYTLNYFELDSTPTINECG